MRISTIILEPGDRLALKVGSQIFFVGHGAVSESLEIELLSGSKIIGVDMDGHLGQPDHAVAGELRLYDEKEDIDERNAAAEDHSAEV